MVEWSKHFPNLNAAQMLACSNDLPGLPIGAEGHFVIPKPERIAKNYHEALEKILEIIGKTRSFTNWRKGELGPKRLKLTERTKAGLAMLSAKYEGDYFLLPAQFGLTYRGKSVQRTRVLYTPTEFGNDPLSVGAMLVTHPERLQSSNDLFIDCPGAEYDYNADGSFDYAPIFNFYDGEVHFYANRVSYYSSYYGSSSAFLPQ